MSGSSNSDQSTRLETKSIVDAFRSGPRTAAIPALAMQELLEELRILLRNFLFPDQMQSGRRGREIGRDRNTRIKGSGSTFGRQGSAPAFASVIAAGDDHTIDMKLGPTGKILKRALR